MLLRCYNINVLWYSVVEYIIYTSHGVVQSGGSRYSF